MTETNGDTKEFASVWRKRLSREGSIRGGTQSATMDEKDHGM